MKRQIMYCDRCRREAPFLMELQIDGTPSDVCPGCAVAIASDFARTDAQEMLVRKPQLLSAEVIRYPKRAEG